MESYEQAVDLALMVVNLDKSVYKTMIRSGLKQFLNSQYQNLTRNNMSKNDNDKFLLASKILLNDLQAIPTNSCGNGRTCSNCMTNECDKNVSYETPVYKEALIDPLNVVNSNVTRYLGGFNPNTFDPSYSRLSHPLDTLGLYKINNDNPVENRVKIDEGKLENFSNTHPIHEARNTLYSQYSSVLVNDNGNGYISEEHIDKVNNQPPSVKNIFYKIHNNKIYHQ